MKNPLAVCLALVTAAPIAYAHHSYAIYDILNRVAIEGEVVSYRYARPHPILVLKETLESGETREWTAEGISVMMWTRSGPFLAAFSTLSLRRLSA